MSPDLPRVLLTGFEPFAGETINPSWEAVRALDGIELAGHVVHAAQLPVTFAGALAALDRLLDAQRPALVLAVGQAGGRAALSFERVAINLIDARIADNDGLQPIDAPVVTGAPSAYFATLPVKAMRAAVADAGIPAELSYSAGCYVCNAVFFALLHRLAGRDDGRAGFVHVPWLPEQPAATAGAPSLALPLIVRGIRAALEAALGRHDDLREAGGFTH